MKASRSFHTIPTGKFCICAIIGLKGRNIVAQGRATDGSAALS